MLTFFPPARPSPTSFIISFSILRYITLLRLSSSTPEEQRRGSRIRKTHYCRSSISGSALLVALDLISFGRNLLVAIVNVQPSVISSILCLNLNTLQIQKFSTFTRHLLVFIFDATLIAIRCLLAI